MIGVDTKGQERLVVPNNKYWAERLKDRNQYHDKYNYIENMTMMLAPVYRKAHFSLQMIFRKTCVISFYGVEKT